MNRRYVILSGLWVLAAVAAGCTPLRGSRPDAPVPPPLGEYRLTNGAPPSGFGEVVPVGGTQPVDAGGTGKFDLSGGQPVGTFQSPPVGQPLPPPRPALPPLPPPGEPKSLPPLPPGVLPVSPLTGSPTPSDPHLLTKPTASGRILGLGPNEVPTDRVLELARHLEVLLAQNRDLVARITELERLGAGREQALVEAIREVEAAENEVAKTRGIILTQKSEIVSLQDKIRQMEREDIDLLKLVIAAFEKLLPSPRREP